VSYLDPYGKSTIDLSLILATVGLLFSPAAIANSDLNSKKIPIQVPPPDRYDSSLQETSDRDRSIPIQVPQAEDRSIPSILPVPSLPIPKGNLTVANPDLEVEAKEVLYRVIVKSRDKELVRSLYPDAFTLIYRGEQVLQVGLFGDRYNALEARDSLINLGLDAAIVD